VDAPLIVENRIDGFSFYESPRALTERLEEWYVDEEEWRAWDASGRRITLVVEDGLVIARALEDIPGHTRELQDALESWLGSRNKVRVADGATTSDLIAAGVEIEGIVAEAVPLAQRVRQILRRR
jgi:hypothetical protein